jgi:N-sulfoglucosamine sulfohydrolase
MHIRFSLLGLFLLGLLCLPPCAGATDRPNILWIVGEDLSAALGCYGDAFADTPRIDQLARVSVRYTRAYATAPACSPSRTCLIRGMPAPSSGTHQMRSTFPVPLELPGFPSLLRKAGIFTSNNAKTDYNCADEPSLIAACWDRCDATAHWRDRTDDRPFFSIFNSMTTHQSRTMVWPHERFVAEVQSRLHPDRIHAPADVIVPPYDPDTPAMRRTLARFYDCVSVFDDEVGALLDQLEADGLAEDTIVFFYTDHGSGMPRHKRVLLETGLHVPLLVRFPVKWQHLAPAAPGEKIDRLVSFEDFGPTVLALSGVPQPDAMSGRPFLREGSEKPRETVFAHRDRIDEVFDVARSVRDGRYRYVRNYHPHLSYNQPSAWADVSEVTADFQQGSDAAGLGDAQRHFLSPTRPLEELYDCENDPANLIDLADSSDPLHQAALVKLRGVLEKHLLDSRDLGFIPEAELRQRIDPGMTPYDLGQSLDRETLQSYLDAADLVGRPGEAWLPGLSAADATIRYWSAVAARAANDLSAAARAALTVALEDEAPDVRIEAATAMAHHGQLDMALPVLTAALDEPDLAAVLRAARAIELLGRAAEATRAAMEATRARMLTRWPDSTDAAGVSLGDANMALFVNFSITSFLAKFDAKF